jgi:hypothetical protein
MIGHYVEHEVHAASVQSIGESLEVVGCSKMGVDAITRNPLVRIPRQFRARGNAHVLLPVTMEGSSLASSFGNLLGNRCNPDCGEPHVLDVIELNQSLSINIPILI